MGGFLPAVVKIQDSNGVRVDRPDVRGTYLPIVVELDSTISHQVRVTEDGFCVVSLSANGTTYADDPTKLPLDGSGTMTGNLKMGAHRQTGLANGIATTDGVNLGQVNSLIDTAITDLFDPNDLNGTASLVGLGDGNPSHAYVYIPGLDSRSAAQVSYSQIIGNPGTPYAQVATNGIHLYSTSDTDGSVVSFHVTAFVEA